jgi:hypothetical protein
MLILPLYTFGGTTSVVVVDVVLLFLQEKKTINSAKKRAMANKLFFLIQLIISKDVLGSTQIIPTKKRNFREITLIL